MYHMRDQQMDSNFDQPQQIVPLAGVLCVPAIVNEGLVNEHRLAAMGFVAGADPHIVQKQFVSGKRKNLAKERSADRHR